MVLNCLNTGIVGSNPTRDFLLCFTALSRVDGRTPVQRILLECPNGFIDSEVNSESEQARGRNPWNVQLKNASLRKRLPLDHPAIRCVHNVITFLIPTPVPQQLVGWEFRHWLRHHSCPVTFLLLQQTLGRVILRCFSIHLFFGFPHVVSRLFAEADRRQLNGKSKWRTKVGNLSAQAWIWTQVGIVVLVERERLFCHECNVTMFHVKRDYLDGLGYAETK